MLFGSFMKLLFQYIKSFGSNQGRRKQFSVRLPPILGPWSVLAASGREVLFSDISKAGLAGLAITAVRPLRDNGTGKKAVAESHLPVTAVEAGGSAVCWTG